MDSMHPRPWIYINGYPGVGKLTIAKELQKLIPDSKIIHNHLVIELCLNAFERASPEYEDLRKAVRREVLNAISTVGRNTTYIFTGSHGTHTPIGPAIARQHLDQAVSQKIPFISVILACEEEENLRRVTSSTRVSKLRDIEALKTIRNNTLFAFQCEHEMNVLDVTNLLPAEAAAKIDEFARDSLAKEKSTYTNVTE